MPREWMWLEGAVFKGEREVLFRGEILKEGRGTLWRTGRVEGRSPRSLWALKGRKEAKHSHNPLLKPIQKNYSLQKPHFPTLTGEVLLNEEIFFFFLAALQGTLDLFPACVLSRVWLFAILWTVACQVPLSVGFSRQEYWSGLSFPSPGDLAHPGIKLELLASPALAGRFFTTEPLGKPLVSWAGIKHRSLH